MKSAKKETIVIAGLSACFLGLAVLFLADSWGKPAAIPRSALVDDAFTNTATVRMSAAELIRTGGDTSGQQCYACHEKEKPVVVKYDAKGLVVLPEEHNDLVMRHGRNNRNDDCFNCHDPQNLVMLKLKNGKTVPLEESSKLCASCHGPSYRDWEIGVHGRGNGYWSKELGAKTRQDCASCHDPHSPEFPSMKPAPGPNQLAGKPAGTNQTTLDTHGHN